MSGLLPRLLLAGGIVVSPTFAFEQTPALQLSSSSLNFAATANGPAPSAQLLTVTASDGSFVNIKALADGGTAGSPAPSWLSVTPSVATTPAQIRVALDPSGLAAGSAYAARILLTDGEGRPLAAAIPVAAQVSNGPAHLNVSPAVVKFAGSISQGNVQEELLLRNDGPGAISPVSVAVVSGYPWLSAEVSTCETVCAVSVRAAIATVTPGSHYGLLKVTTALGTQDIPVSLFAADHGPFLQLTATGEQFHGMEVSGLVDSRTVSIRNIGDAAANWSASVVDGQAWLSVSPSSGVIEPQGSTDLVITMNAGSMGAQTYGGLIQVSSRDGNFGVLDIPVILRLDSLGTPPVPLPSTGGLVFQLQSGAEGIQQPLTLAAASPAAVSYQASPESAGSLWLSVSPTRGQVTGSTPAPLSAVAASIGLLPGFYGGAITLALGNQNVRTLHAGFSVTTSTGQACVPQQLYLTQTGIPDGFAARTGFPTPLEAVLVDDCGNFVSNAMVSATFSNGDPGIAMEPIGYGQYAGTWIPAHASDALPGGAASVELQAFAPRLAPGTTDAIGTVTADTAPAINAGGVLNTLNAQPGAPVAPGAVIQIYGSQFGTATGTGTVTNARLSTTLNGVSVSIGGLDAPLYYSSPGQINAQVPLELAGNQPYQVIINVNGVYSNPEVINTVPAQPGIAVYADGSAIAQDRAFNLITAKHPAHPGDSMILYLTGMGATTPAVLTGAAAPSSPLAQVAVQPQVTIDGAPAQVLFAGLTPGAVGLYQVDVRIPSAARTGDLPIVVMQGSASSNTATVPVQ